MRSIRVSLTFQDQLAALLAQGEDRYSAAILEEKKSLVYRTIRSHLAYFPASRRRDPDLGLHVYPVSNTPFVLIYDLDDAELRVHFVLHARADRTRIDPSNIEW